MLIALVSLQLPPEGQVYDVPGANLSSISFLERSLLRCTMEKYHEYQQWYSMLLMDLYSGSSVEEIFERALDSPVFIRSWKQTQSDPTLV
uniref:Uncharacterized protein n=1 Tax=Utricularia reniformis TaxID=192314 RepID=A0A1Y0B0K6_9LAMI|nr:hypothetical protein AEK19_MT0651 [Utricularia reniformis]ART30904.1 hypothetical protein AEK19_MT0651 [Utricularia reniformis]